MNLQSNDFVLFGVPVQFVQEPVALDERWKELQREAHPDKFVSSDDAARRLAMQWSVRINEAYQRLKDPLRRAAYLCELHGAPIRADSNTGMPTSFLMQQMAWREALDEAGTLVELDTLDQEIAMARQFLLGQCQQLLDVACDYHGAVEPVRALMFVERFAGDVEAKRDRLENTV